MAKDPAFLFYYQDWAYGTRKMSFEEKGVYIELLCEQADTGHFSLDDVKRALNSHFPIWSTISKKFDQDEHGLFYNAVLDEHIKKRKKYVKSRINNLKSTKKPTHMDVHMVRHMENVNENRNKNINRIEKDAFERIWNQYPKRIGKKTAMRHFKVSVKTKEDLTRLEQALVNYLSSKRVKNGFVQNGSTFMNNWEDWVSYKEETCQLCNDKGSYISSTGYSVICECPAGKRK